MRRTQWTVLLTTLALALFLLAGCGGSTPPDPPEPAPSQQSSPAPAEPPASQPPAAAPAKDAAPEEVRPEAAPSPAPEPPDSQQQLPGGEPATNTQPATAPQTTTTPQPAPDGQTAADTPPAAPAAPEAPPAAPAETPAPEPAPADSAPTQAPPEDGSYTASVTLEGGSGRATIASPAQLRCENGQFWATIVWSSPNFDYMKVDGEKYTLISTEGNSTFEIPVAAFDQKLDVIADTVAMSEPHEVAYTLFFDSATLQKQ